MGLKIKNNSTTAQTRIFVGQTEVVMAANGGLSQAFPDQDLINIAVAIAPHSDLEILYPSEAGGIGGYGDTDALSASIQSGVLNSEEAQKGATHNAIQTGINNGVSSHNSSETAHTTEFGAKAAKAATIVTVDASDLPTAITLVNELKTKMNTMNA